MSLIHSLTHVLRPRLTVQPWQVALERRDGEPTRVLRSGRHARVELVQPGRTSSRDD